MILSNTLVGKSHYEIIGTNEEATQEDIRKAYRSSILNFHPDKQPRSSETTHPEHDSGNQFLEVQRAWEILGDPRSRALYDSELRKLRQDSLNADDVNLVDMIAEDVGSVFEFSYDCTCGDFFAIDSSEIEEMGYPFSRNGSEVYLREISSLPASIILPCGSCSRKIRLVMDGGVKTQLKLNN